MSFCVTFQKLTQLLLRNTYSQVKYVLKIDCCIDRLNLAKIDLPAGYENWKSWQSAKREVTKSLKKEIEDKRKSNDVSVSNLYCDNEENEETQILLLDSDHNANLDSGLVNSEVNIISFLQLMRHIIVMQKT